MTSNYVSLRGSMNKVDKDDSYKIELVNARDRAELAAKNAKVSESNAANSAQNSSDSAEKATKVSEAAAKSAEKAALEKQDAIKAKDAASESNLAAQEANGYAQKAAEQASQILENTQRCYEQTVAEANKAMMSQSSAQTSAANASNSANIASKASNDAAKSNTDAEQAKLIAEDAKNKAETAQRAAELSETNAYSHELKSLEAKTTSENSAIQAKKYAEASAGSAAKAAEAAQGVAADREQIRANTAGLETAQQDMTNLKAETARTARSLDYLWKKSKGIIYDTETVTGAGSSVTVPSGAMDYAVLRMIGGMSQRDAENNVLIDAPVGEVRVSNAAGDSTNTYQIPQAIRDLCPDYGIGVSADCYNYIDFGAKQYQRRVGKYIFDGTENYLSITQIGMHYRAVISVKISRKPKLYNVIFAAYAWDYSYSTDTKHYYVDPQNLNDGNSRIFVFDRYATIDALREALIGAVLHYELATPEIIDLSAVWPDDDFGVLRVEAGGTINLHYPALDDDYELAVPSETEIMVDVAKVVQTNG